MNTSHKRDKLLKCFLFLILFSLQNTLSFSQNLPQITTLENGLKILTLENHTAPIVVFMVWYKVGSRNEHTGITGISHLLEHMLFKSTKNYPKGAIDKILRKNGASFNAMTGEDLTVYYEIIASDRVETAIKIEADRMKNAKLTENELKPELTVVKSELEIGENQPQFLLYREVRASAYTTHPYRWSVAGCKEDILNVTPKKIKTYYNTYYHPNNATVIILGDFERDAMIKLIKKYFGNIKRGPDIPKVISVEPEQKGEKRIVLKGEGNASHIAVAYHIPEITHPDIYPLEVLNKVLSSGETSRLYKRLVIGNLAATFYTDVEKRIDPGLFGILATARTGVELSKIENAFYEEIEKIKKEGITDEEFKKVIAKTSAGYFYDKDSIVSLAFALGEAEVMSSYKYYLDYLENLRKVTIEDVKRVCEKYLQDVNRTTGYFTPIKPKEEREELESPFEKKFYYKREDLKIRREVLDNGMRVIIMEDKANPTVSIAGNIRGGIIYEPQKLPGLSLIVAEMLNKGTKTRNREEISKSLEEIGASLYISPLSNIASLGGFLSVLSFIETATFSGRCLSKDTDKVLDILSNILQNPTFPDEELQRLRLLLYTGLQVASDSPEARALLTIFELMYPEEHPFHNFSTNSLSRCIKRIKRDDLIKFHQEHYGGENTILVIAGDVDTEKILGRIKELFSNWRCSKGEAKVNLPQVEIPKEKKKKIVSMMDKKQCAVIAGYPINLTRKSPDYYAVEVMDNIFGGGSISSRLGKKIREEKGYSYFVGSVFFVGLFPGPYGFAFTINPDNLQDGIKTFTDEMKKFKESGVTKEEFEDIISYITGSHPRTLATKSGIAWHLLNAEYYGLGLDYPWECMKYYKSLKIEDINNAAKNYLHPDNLVIVITGPYKE